MVSDLKLVLGSIKSDVCSSVTALDTVSTSALVRTARNTIHNRKQTHARSDRALYNDERPQSISLVSAALELANGVLLILFTWQRVPSDLRHFPYSDAITQRIQATIINDASIKFG